MVEQVLPLLKARLGISTNVRDSLLSALIDGIMSECRNMHEIELDAAQADQLVFVLDWATWKYNHPEDGTTPRSIQFRLRNLIMKKGAAGSGQPNMG